MNETVAAVSVFLGFAIARLILLLRRYEVCSLFGRPCRS